jgi:hypothetical protein
MKPSEPGLFVERIVDRVADGIAGRVSLKVGCWIRER